MKSLTAFLVGLVFALGLGISGMTQSQVVKRFLDVFGNWNPALLGVMVGAISIHFVFFRFITKMKTPLLDTQFYIPSAKSIDKNLVLGSALFGLGWGWSGICPGPGIVSSMSGNISIIIFVASMLSGMILFKVFKSVQS